VSKGRLRLNPYEVAVVVPPRTGRGRVGHLPDDDGGDLHRITFSVVDLEVVRLEVSNSQRSRPVIGERNDPREAGVAHGADVTAKELNNACLPGLDDDEGAEDNHGEDDRYDNENL